jgi:mRNA interferase MazF
LKEQLLAVKDQIDAMTKHTQDSSPPSYQRGDVIWADLPRRGGSVQSGKRPCVIISNDKYHDETDSFIVVPLTMQGKKLELPTVAFVERTNMTAPSYLHGESTTTLHKSLVLSKIREMDVEDVKSAVRVTKAHLIDVVELYSNLSPSHVRGEIYLLSNGQGEFPIHTPVLIISNDKGNCFSSNVTVIPIVPDFQNESKTLIKVGIPSRFTGLPFDSILRLDYINVIDKDRLGSLVGNLSVNYYKKLEQTIEGFIG